MSAKWVAVVALLAFASATIAAQSFDAGDEGAHNRHLNSHIKGKLTGAKWLAKAIALHKHKKEEKEEEPEKPIIYKQTAGTKVILEEEQKKEIVYKKTGDVKIVHPEVPNHTHHVVHKPVHGKEVEQTLPAVHDKLFTYVSGTHTERVHPQKPHHDKIQKYDRHGKGSLHH